MKSAKSEHVDTIPKQTPASWGSYSLSAHRRAPFLDEVRVYQGAQVQHMPKGR